MRRNSPSVEMIPHDIVITITNLQSEPLKPIISEIIRELRASYPNSIAMFLSLVSGGMDAWFEWKLGEQFANRFTTFAKINSEMGADIIRGLFSFISWSTTVALISLPLRDLLIEKFVKASPYNPPNKHPYLKNFALASVVFASLLSCTPYAYGFKLNFEDELATQIAFVMSAYFNGFACSYLGTRPYVSRFFARYNMEPDQIQLQRKQLADKFYFIAESLHAAPKEKISRIYEVSQQYQDAAETPQFESVFYNTVRTELNITNEIIPGSPKSFSLKRFMGEVVSLGIGGISCAGLFSLNMDGIQWVYDKANIPFNESDYVLSVIGMIPLSLFFGGLIQTRCERIYHALFTPGFHFNQQTSHPKLRVAINYFSLLISGIACTPNTDLTIQSYEAGEIPLGFSPAVASALIFALSEMVDELLQESVDWVDTHFYTADPDVQRDFLIKIFTNFSGVAQTHLDPEGVMQFHELVFPQQVSPSIIRSISSTSSCEHDDPEEPESAPLPRVSQGGMFGRNQKALATSISSPNLTALHFDYDSEKLKR